MTSRKKPGKLRAWGELTRISNALTVLTNVLVGVSVVPGWRSDLPQWGSSRRICDLSLQQWTLTLVIGASLLLMYVAGMALNDWADRDADQRDARKRPLPSGRIAPGSALLFGMITLVAGAALLGIFGVPALAAGGILALLILAYDLLHKQHPWAVFLMGGCRAMVYVIAAVAVTGVDASTWWPGLLVLIYTALLTLVARSERGGKASRFGWIAWFLPLLFAAAFAFRSPSAHVPWSVIVGALMGTWLVRSAMLANSRRRRVGKAVLGWLSGFCLIDAFFLALLDQPCLSVLAVIAWMVTAISHTRISGT